MDIAISLLEMRDSRCGTLYQNSIAIAGARAKKNPFSELSLDERLMFTSVTPNSSIYCISYCSDFRPAFKAKNVIPSESESKLGVFTQPNAVHKNL